MNDVERVDEYTTGLESEAYAPVPAGDSGTRLAKPSWPADGTIEFRGVRLKYDAATTPAFDYLSFSIPARTRVGEGRECGVCGAAVEDGAGYRARRVWGRRGAPGLQEVGGALRVAYDDGRRGRQPCR